MQSKLLNIGAELKTDWFTGLEIRQQSDTDKMYSAGPFGTFLLSFLARPKISNVESFDIWRL